MELYLFTFLHLALTSSLINIRLNSAFFRMVLVDCRFPSAILLCLSNRGHEYCQLTQENRSAFFDGIKFHLQKKYKERYGLNRSRCLNVLWKRWCLIVNCVCCASHKKWKKKTTTTTKTKKIPVCWRETSVLTSSVSEKRRVIG